MGKELTVITGKRVVLFGMEYESDLAYMEKLLTPETKALILGFPPPITADSTGWIIKTMQGKASKTVGIICITPITVVGVACQVIIDPMYADGLSERVKAGNPTYVEESIRLLSDSVLSNGYRLSRIEIGVIKGDELSEALFRKGGFEAEGTLRKGCVKDNALCDLVIMSKVKDLDLKEAENGETNKEAEEKRTTSAQTESPVTGGPDNA